jgi:biopolymer transport protein ExbD
MRLHEPHGRIHKPEKVLLHGIPLRFVKNKVVGGGKKSVDQNLPLIPFIDLLISLVVFLLMSFSASGELLAQSNTITLPTAEHTVALESAPVIAIDARVVTLDHRQVADTPTLAQTAQIDRIEPLISGLEQHLANWRVLHPNDESPRMVILQADHAIDFRVVKKVMFSCGQAGYANVSFAVNSTHAN